MEAGVRREASSGKAGEGRCGQREQPRTGPELMGARPPPALQPGFGATTTSWAEQPVPWCPLHHWESVRA